MLITHICWLPMWEDHFFDLRHLISSIPTAGELIPAAIDISPPADGPSYPCVGLGARVGTAREPSRDWFSNNVTWFMCVAVKPCFWQPLKSDASGLVLIQRVWTLCAMLLTIVCHMISTDWLIGVWKGTNTSPSFVISSILLISASIYTPPQE